MPAGRRIVGCMFPGALVSDGGMWWREKTSAGHGRYK
jgi:hypothetical protein